MAMSNFNPAASFGIPLMGSFAMPLSVPYPGTGRVLVVDPAGNGNQLSQFAYTTIQGALNATSDGTGDTILVFPGTYDENLTVSNDYVTIIGIQQAGYAKPDVAPTTGVALVVSGQGFQCAHMRFVSADSDTVQQNGNGFFYTDVVFDGDAGQAATEACLRLVGAVDDSHTASEGRIIDCLFRGSTSGAGIIFQHATAAAGGTGVSDDQIINCTFVDNGVDLLSATNTTGGGAGIFLRCLIRGCNFLTTGAAYVYGNMDQGAAGDLSANSCLICDNFFADDAFIAAQFDISGQPKVFFVGNYAAPGLIDGSTFND